MGASAAACARPPSATDRQQVQAGLLSYKSHQLAPSPCCLRHPCHQSHGQRLYTCLQSRNVSAQTVSESDPVQSGSRPVLCGSPLRWGWLIVCDEELAACRTVALQGSITLAAKQCNGSPDPAEAQMPSGSRCPAAMLRQRHTSRIWHLQPLRCSRATDASSYEQSGAIQEFAECALQEPGAVSNLIIA